MIIVCKIVVAHKAFVGGYSRNNPYDHFKKISILLVVSSHDQMIVLIGETFFSPPFHT